MPGHETIGDVVATGPGEEKWKVGNRVGAAWHGGHDGMSLYVRGGGEGGAGDVSRLT